MKLAQLTGRNNRTIVNEKRKLPSEPFYGLSVPLPDGKELPLNTTAGRKVLLVNTASDCGYTAQYEDLQQLQRHFGDKLLVIGFPANDFKAQEKGNDEEIAAFCTTNFSVTFPIAKKSSVVRSREQNEIFQWLTDARKNGWNNQPPVWNFSKYLVNEQGVLTHYFDPSVSPVGAEVIKAINS